MNVMFGILGRTAVLDDDGLSENWGRPRERALLATLLVQPGRTIPIGTLIDWVWPSEKAAPENPASTLYTYAARIRRWLRHLQPTPQLSAGYGGYRLDVAKTMIDYFQFRALIAEAREFTRRQEDDQAVAFAQRAVSLWRGRPLDDLASEPAEAWRHRVVADEWIPANTTLLEALLATGRNDETLSRLNDLQAEHGDDVNLAKVRLSVLHAMGRPAEQDAYYLNVRRRLLREGDDQAAGHLRAHQERLATDTAAHPRVVADAVRLVPRQLPHDVADFIGRDGLLAALDAAIADRTESGGIVIVDGMAGSGKTALIVHWARRNRDRFPDGDFYVNLNGFSASPPLSHASVVDDLLIALGYPPTDKHNQREKELLLSQLFTDRRALVVLDNAKDSSHVLRLVPLLSNCQIVVASRQNLTTLSTTTGARRVRVEPMTIGEAVTLLRTRIDPRHEIDRADAIRLVRLCDLLPLVINVVAEHIANRRSPQLAAFIRALTTAEVLTEIGHNADRTPNAQTLFMWSYQALATWDRRLFCLVGLHSGADFSIETARAYDGRTASQTRRSLETLVDAHLLEQPRAFDRYQFHDLLREFAAHRAHQDLPSHQVSAAETRALSRYLAKATAAHQVLSPSRRTPPSVPGEPTIDVPAFQDSAHAKAWFDIERGNLLAMVDYGAARGHHEHTWRLADTIADLFERHGYYSDSKTIRSVALASAATVGDHEAEASSRTGLGMVHMILGEYAEARRCLDAAMRFAEENANLVGQGSALHQLGKLEMLSGDLLEAVRLFERCLKVNQGLRDHRGIGWTHCRLAEALRRLDRYDEALLHLHQAQFHIQRGEDTVARAVVLAELGSLCRDRGDHQSAATYCDEASKIIDSAPIADRAGTIYVCHALATTWGRLKDVDRALGYARRALDISRTTGHVDFECKSWDVLGELYYDSGESQHAVEAWERASALYDKLGNPTRGTNLRIAIRRIRTSSTDVPRARSVSAQPDNQPTNAGDCPLA